MMQAAVGLCEWGLTSLTVLSEEAETTINVKAKQNTQGKRLAFFEECV